jgi:uncharacterized protein YndB with AHSA1/START domain
MSTRVDSIEPSCQRIVEMADGFVARVSLSIDAPPATVWDALVNPAAIKEYLPVTSVSSEWRRGSPIVWRSEFQGKPFEVKGTVLRVEPERLLEYEHSRPIFRPSQAVTPKLYQRVTIELSADGSKTRVSVTEDNNVSPPELAHSEGGWRLALHNLKALLEGSR